jgi:hypothetical protein
MKSLLALLLLAASAYAADRLPSWNGTTTIKAIVIFVERATRKCSADFLPTAERIAAFDNDGTLLSEQSIYFHATLMLYQIKPLASQHPEWPTKHPLKAALEGNLNTISAGGERAFLELIVASQAGNTTEEFA